MLLTKKRVRIKPEIETSQSYLLSAILSSVITMSYKLEVLPVLHGGKQPI